MDVHEIVKDYLDEGTHENSATNRKPPFFPPDQDIDKHKERYGDEMAKYCNRSCQAVDSQEHMSDLF